MVSVSKLELRVTRLENDRDSIYELVSDIQKTVRNHTDRLDGIDRRLDGIDGRLDGIDGRLDGIDGRLDRMDTRFDAIDGTLAEILRRLPAV